MTYKQAITDAMTQLAADPAVCFLGYGVTHGKAMGTLANVKPEQLIETPVAENLMVGLAIGVALRGRKPVVFIERCDFILNAMDAIVNHLAKIRKMSGGEFVPAVILRVIVGNKEKPLFTGETHTQDFFQGIREMTRSDPMAIYRIPAIEWTERTYSLANQNLDAGVSSLVFEYKDGY